MMGRGWLVLYSLHSSQLFSLISELPPIPVFCKCRGTNFYHLHCSLSCVLGCVSFDLIYLIIIMISISLPTFHQKLVKISHHLMFFSHFISVVMNLFTLILEGQEGKCGDRSEPNAHVLSSIFQLLQ